MRIEPANKIDCRNECWSPNLSLKSASSFIYVYHCTIRRLDYSTIWPLYDSTIPPLYRSTNRPIDDATIVLKSTVLDDSTIVPFDYSWWFYHCTIRRFDDSPVVHWTIRRFYLLPFDDSKIVPFDESTIPLFYNAKIRLIWRFYHCTIRWLDDSAIVPLYHLTILLYIRRFRHCTIRRFHYSTIPLLYHSTIRRFHTIVPFESTILLFPRRFD